MKVRLQNYTDNHRYAVVTTAAGEYHFRLDDTDPAKSLLDYAALQREKAARLLKHAAIAEEASTRV